MHQYKAEAESRAVNVKPTELPDAHLVQMAQRDPAAFVHLYDRHIEAIYRYCSMRLNGAAAEDATSITFLNALKAIDRFDVSRSLVFGPGFTRLRTTPWSINSGSAVMSRSRPSKLRTTRARWMTMWWPSISDGKSNGPSIIYRQINNR